MYVFVTNKLFNSENFCIYGFHGAIFKMLTMENDKKPKFEFSIIQLLFVTNLQYLPLNVYFGEWQILSNYTQNWCISVKVSKAKIAGNRGYYMEPQQQFMLHYEQFWKMCIVIKMTKLTAT